MPFRARACLVIHKSKIEMTSLKDKLCVCVCVCSESLKLCFDAKCDTALFLRIQSFILIALKEYLIANFLH